MNTGSAPRKARRATVSNRFGEPMKPLWIRYFALLLLCCLAGAAQAAPAPRASVDRNVVDQGDSLILTIRVDDTGSLAEPDLSALERDFDIAGSNQSSQHVIINGRAESWTEWQTVLVPKRSGQLTIPALAVAGGRTQPLTVRVNQADAGAAGEGSEPVFMEVKLDRNSVYVQQQLLLTVRIFHAIQLDNMHITEPDFDNASVRKGTETNFRREINGVTYVVHELNYAIFPQQPGQLTIPEMVFSASQPLRTRSLFDFPGQGRPVRKVSQQFTVNVKPIPKSFTGSVWLPASHLTLEQAWSDDPKHVTVGESITRNITVRADGLQAAQLPTLAPPKVAGAKLYSDQPTLDDQQDGNGVHSRRVESTALIPSQPGQLQLPEAKVVWWDVDSDTEQVATLPAQSLNVEPGAASAAGSGHAPVIAEPQPTPAPGATAAPAAAPASHWWQLGAALLALAWLITLALYWRLRRGLRQKRPQATTDSAPAAANEDTAFRVLAAACRDHDTTTARAALLEWGRCFYRAPELRSVDQLLQRSGDAALARELQQLDNRLFGARPDSGDWNGENLLEVVRRLRRTPPGKATEESGLPPLYPVR